jgi:hypothetical protein
LTNVVGSTLCGTSFTTKEGEVTIPLTFLIAHALNGYEAILRATFLMNPDMTSAITPAHLSHTRVQKLKHRIGNCTKENPRKLHVLRENYYTPGVSTNISAKVSPPF